MDTWKSRDDWWVVCQTLRPDYTREQFDADMDEFVRIKTERLNWRHRRSDKIAIFCTSPALSTTKEDGR